MNLKDKNRRFDHDAFFHALLELLNVIDFSLWPDEDRRIMGDNGRVGPLPGELEAMGLGTTGSGFDWLRRIIAGTPGRTLKPCPYTDRLVALLGSQSRLVFHVKQALQEGLDHKNMSIAAACLPPLTIFCQHACDVDEIENLVHQMAESMATIGLDFGIHYLRAIQTLLAIGNTAVSKEPGFLRDIIAQDIVSWGPILLLALNETNTDVRAQTCEIVNILLLEPLEEAYQTQAADYRVYQQRAVRLAHKTAEYIRSAFLTSSSNEVLQSGHSLAADQVLNRCLATMEINNASQEDQVARIQQVLTDFRARADQVVEAMSPDWQGESSELDPMSDDFDELVSS
jgi:hypothetical protein